jgi:hypothetical protein
MGRNLTMRCEEHVRNLKLNKDESPFTQHILNKCHQYGPMTEVMEIMEYSNKGNLMKTKEHFYIYYFNKLDNIIQHQYMLTQMS